MKRKRLGKPVLAEDKCYNNEAWNKKQKLKLVCWACQPMVDGSGHDIRQKCVNPRPFEKDSAALNLKSASGWREEYNRMKHQVLDRKRRKKQAKLAARRAAQKEKDKNKERERKKKNKEEQKEKEREKEQERIQISLEGNSHSERQVDKDEMLKGLEAFFPGLFLANLKDMEEKIGAIQEREKNAEEKMRKAKRKKKKARKLVQDMKSHQENQDAIAKEHLRLLAESKAEKDNLQQRYESSIEKWRVAFRNEQRRREEAEKEIREVRCEPSSEVIDFLI